MLNLELKQAEVALAAGRLDEAFDLVRKPDNRRTRRGQELFTSLAEAFVQRGHEHLASKRLAPAGSDAAKAIQCAGQKPEAVELFHAVAEARESDNQERRHRDEVMAAARYQAAEGEDSLAGRIAGNVDLKTTVARQFSEQLEVQKVVRNSAVQSIKSLSADGKHDLALEKLLKAADSQTMNSDLIELIPEVTKPRLVEAVEQVNAGRLDLAATSEQKLKRFAKHHPPIAEFVESVQRCQRVHRLLEKGQLNDALRQLRLVNQQLPNAMWVSSGVEKLGNAIANLEELHGGPLGLICETNDEHDALPSAELAKTTGLASVRPRAAQPDPDSMLLRIDGFGSVLLLFKETVSIGASRSKCDISLASEGITANAFISRETNDYLLQASTPIRMERQTAKKHLLVNGDRFFVGNRGHLQFRRPVEASASAVIESLGGPLAGTDIRHVVLFADSLILSSQPYAHCCIPNQATDLVLFRTDNGLAVRTRDRAAQSLKTPIKLGESIEIDQRRIKLTEFCHGNV